MNRIEPAQFSDYPHSNTKLCTFVEVLSAIESLYLDVVEDRIHEAERSYMDNYQKSLKQSRALDKATDAQGWWDILSRLAACLLAAVSLIGGATLLTSESSFTELVLGGTLLLSGASTMMGTILNELQTHPELGDLLTTIGEAVGLLSGAGMALFSNHTTQELVGKIATTSIGIVSHLSDVARESHAQNLSHLKASNALVHHAFKNQQDLLLTTNRDAEFFAERLTDDIQICATMQKKQEQSIRKILWEVQG